MPFQWKEPNEATPPVPIDEQISSDSKEPRSDVGGVSTKARPSLPRSAERFGVQVFGFGQVGRSNTQVSQNDGPLFLVDGQESRLQVRTGISVDGDHHIAKTNRTQLGNNLLAHGHLTPQVGTRLDAHLFRGNA
jgi:hypothetical protein